MLSRVVLLFHVGNVFSLLPQVEKTIRQTKTDVEIQPANTMFRLTKGAKVCILELGTHFFGELVEDSLWVLSRGRCAMLQRIETLGHESEARRKEKVRTPPHALPTISFLSSRPLSRWWTQFTRHDPVRRNPVSETQGKTMLKLLKHVSESLMDDDLEQDLFRL